MQNLTSTRRKVLSSWLENDGIHAGNIDGNGHNLQMIKGNQYNIYVLNVRVGDGPSRSTSMIKYEKVEGDDSKAWQDSEFPVREIIKELERDREERTIRNQRSMGMIMAGENDESHNGCQCYSCSEQESSDDSEPEDNYDASEREAEQDDFRSLRRKAKTALARSDDEEDDFQRRFPPLEESMDNDWGVSWNPQGTLQAGLGENRRQKEARDHSAAWSTEATYSGSRNGRSRSKSRKEKKTRREK